MINLKKLGLKRNELQRIKQPNEKILNVKIPENTSSRLQALQDHGFGSTDHIVTEAISSYAITKLKEQKDFEFLDSEAKMMTNRRKMVFSDYGRE